MKKRKYNLLFVAIVVCYGLLYMATSVPDKECIPCNQLSALYQKLSVNKTYITQVNSCSLQNTVDTVCISVKDTTGVNWTALADTACLYSKQQNMPTKAVYILKDNVFPRDTLAAVICP